MRNESTARLNSENAVAAAAAAHTATAADSTTIDFSAFKKVSRIRAQRYLKPQEPNTQNKAAALDPAKHYNAIHRLYFRSLEIWHDESAAYTHKHRKSKALLQSLSPGRSGDRHMRHSPSKAAAANARTLDPHAPVRSPSLAATKYEKTKSVSPPPPPPQQQQAPPPVEPALPHTPRSLRARKTPRQRQGRSSRLAKKASSSRLEKHKEGMGSKKASKASLKKAIRVEQVPRNAERISPYPEVNLPSIGRNKVELSEILHEHERNRDRKTRLKEKNVSKPMIDYAHFHSAQHPSNTSLHLHNLPVIENAKSSKGATAQRFSPGRARDEEKQEEEEEEGEGEASRRESDVLAKYVSQLRESQEVLENARPSVGKLMKDITDTQLLELLRSYIPKRRQEHNRFDNSFEEALIKAVLKAQDEDLRGAADDEEFETQLRRTQTSFGRQFTFGGAKAASESEQSSTMAQEPTIRHLIKDLKERKGFFEFYKKRLLPKHREQRSF